MRAAEWINRWAAGPAVTFLLIGAGAFLWCGPGRRLWTRPRDVLRLWRCERSARGETFRALCMALGGTLGVGNIAGVALAVAVGGAGAIFWMAAVATL
ncbi:MAG: sodium:alanine symporter family protein, partial [Clostridia bacterium]|nr:sodium:alanine symporter family protein [Clostridia bacterium]